jgi:hypothetical protein
MLRPTFDTADIVRVHLPALLCAQPLTTEQAEVLKAITLCRTAALGGHTNHCVECGLCEDSSYNSCRNRHCPKCQALTQERWIEGRARAILPIPHFHVVFTLPEEFRPLARDHPRQIYDALFRCTSATLLEMGRSRLGITLGITMVLHTWTRELLFHPHVHVLVSGGGLVPGGEEFKLTREKFLLHQRPMGELFRKKMLDALRGMWEEGLFQMTEGAFGYLIARLAGQDWNIYLKEAFHTPALVLAYIGRYTHRVGISNSRILDVKPDHVTFRSKDGRTVTLHPVVFLQRFVQHILPEGFKKIRHAGLYASPKALAQAKALVGEAPLDKPAAQPSWQEALLALTGRDVRRCQACGGELHHTVLLPERIGSNRRPRSPTTGGPP